MCPYLKIGSLNIPMYSLRGAAGILLGWLLREPRPAYLVWIRTTALFRICTVSSALSPAQSFYRSF